MAFKGNVNISIEQLSGYDEFGQPAIASALNIKCKVVKLLTDLSQTVSRMSQSATLGNADEYVADGIFLVAPNSAVKIGDKATVAGTAFRVDKKIVQYTTTSIVHHWQIECSIWV